MLDLVVTSKVWTGTTCLTTTAPSWLIFKIFPICHLARLLRTHLMRKHYPPLALLLAHSKQFSGHSRRERDLLSKLEMRKKIPIISTYKQLFASSDYLRKSDRLKIAK